MHPSPGRLALRLCLLFHQVQTTHLMTIGAATMFTVSTDTPKAHIYGFSILLGASTCLLFPAGYTVGGVKIMMT
jgi:hypothetical protein